MSTTKRKSGLPFVLKIVAIILGIILILVVGGYCYLKYALGIDIIDIKKKVDLINKNVSESAIITNPYSEEDVPNGLIGMFGDDSMYSNEDGAVSLNIESFYASQLLDDAKLTDKQLCSLANILLKQALSGSEQENIANNVEIKQIKFSNLTLQSGKTKVDINVVAKFDLNKFKQPLKEKNNGFVNFLLKYIPDALYISDNFTMEVNNTDYSYTTKTNSFVINQLSKEDSEGIIKLYDNFFGGEKGFVDETHNTVLGYVFGNSDQNGLINSLNGLIGFNFEEIQNTIYILLKKA